MTTVLLLTLLAAGPGAATPVQAPASAAQVPVAATPAVPDTYNYNPEGRRDPFVSLLKGGADDRGARPGATGAEGLAGLNVDEISVRGVVAGSGGSYLAMVQGPDNKTFIVRANDKLLDGTVKAVTAQGLVILQEVNDPLSLVKQKEVRKMLRGLEEGK
jgi:type IV pilus assembly protein PilP